MNGGPKLAALASGWLLAAACSDPVLAQDALPLSPVWPRHTIDDSSRGADGVRRADVNGDGWPDFVTGWEEGGLVRVYLHPGPASVRDRWPAVTVGEVGSPEDALLVDLDRDGAWDVVSCCEGRQRTVFVHWAPSSAEQYLEPAKWTTAPLPCTAELQQWMFAAPLAVNGRSGVDLVVGSKSTSGAIGLLVAPRRPRDLTAWQYVRLRDAGWIMSLIVHDLDRDGDLDILFSDRKGLRSGVSWLEQPAAQFALDPRQWREHVVGLAGQEVMFLSLDLSTGAEPVPRIFAATHHGRIAELHRAAGGWREQTVANPFAAPHGKGIAVGDLDLDGDLDLVHSTEPPRVASGVAWLESTPDGYRTHAISGPAGQKFDLLELVDLDGDGDLDVITCEERDNLGVIWFENPARQP